MCTQCTLTRVVRCRVKKDWALNFLTCGFPLEEPEKFCSPSHQVSSVNMVFDTVDDTKNSASKGQKNRLMIRSSTKASDSNTVSLKKGSTDDQSNWPHFAEEDYIVFCFGEDGAFDVVKDVKSEASNQVDFTKSPRPVNRKLNYDENAETFSKQRHDEVVLNPRNQRDLIKSDKEVIEEEEKEEMIDKRSPSVESSGSNQSDHSTGSFAFPILGWEWTGSPVQMPKTEGLHFRKDKARFVPFHCFRIFEKN